jgi:hypothetical protein
MSKDIQYDIFLIDILDFFYYSYSDVLINKDRYKTIKGVRPVISYNIILKFLKNLESKHSNTNTKYFFYIKNFDTKSLDLKKIKISISKREKNIDYHFEYFFNIFVEILKNYKKGYYLYFNNNSITDSIIDYNKDKNILIISTKMDNCHYLMDSDSVYWYNHNFTYDKKSFTDNYKFIPTHSKISLFNILSKKPIYKTKIYKNFNISNEVILYLTNKFNSFDDLSSNYMSQVSEELRKKIYNWMKILLINKQSIRNSEYSVFDLDMNHIFQSKENLDFLSIWKKILKIDI